MTIIGFGLHCWILFIATCMSPHFNIIVVVEFLNTTLKVSKISSNQLFSCYARGARFVTITLKKMTTFIWLVKLKRKTFKISCHLLQINFVILYCVILLSLQLNICLFGNIGVRFDGSKSPLLIKHFLSIKSLLHTLYLQSKMRRNLVVFAFK